MVDSSVKRFDFLRDGEQSAVARLRSFRLAKTLRWPVAVLLTVVATHAGAQAIFVIAIGSAAATEREAASRFESSRAEVARVHLQRLRLNDFVALDVRLRQIRYSGNRASARLADLANHVPAHVWLTSLTRTPGEFELVGQSSGLPALGATMSRLMMSSAIENPTLVRAAGEESGRTIAFDIKATETK